ncbi:hypothetical protein [Clostridium sp.]|uniref:hypothetical protein n=1 Tax=Clostridium sp. TaxID=1506 RepID=UPI0025B8C365|nr:hypothetical protein [Clostridium sp.]
MKKGIGAKNGENGVFNMNEYGNKFGWKTRGTPRKFLNVSKLEGSGLKHKIELRGEIKEAYKGVEKK